MSTARYETLPTTLIEGQAAGCTPVAFDSSGQCDIISNAKEGILVPSFDTAAFAEALNRALDTPLEAARPPRLGGAPLFRRQSGSRIHRPAQQDYYLQIVSARPFMSMQAARGRSPHPQ